MPPRTNSAFCRSHTLSLSLVTLFALVSLIVSAWPHKPAAAQSAETTSIRRVPLKVNDVVYSATTKMLYVSVPSDAGAMGNSIATINPVTGEIVSSVFVGSEPDRLALADDGSTLYVALDGAFAIRRFDVVAQTPGQQFDLGLESFYGLYTVRDLAVAPGNQDVIAVARRYSDSSFEAGVAVFENGVQRPKVGPGFSEGSEFLAYSAVASKLYGTSYYDSKLSTMSIDSTGVTVSGETPFSVVGRIKFDGGLVFSSMGQVINPDAGTLLGTFSLDRGSVYFASFAPDLTVGRAYYATRNGFSSSEIELKAFDTNTFVPIGSVALAGVTEDPTHLIRWGANGLALRSQNGQLFLIQTTLIPSSETVPSTQPLPSPAPTPTPAYVATLVRRIKLQANDIVYNQSTERLYASVPSTAGAGGNTITAIDPRAGAVSTGVFIGSEPGKLALSDDGQTLYAYLNGANAVRRFDVQTQTAGLQFALDANQQPADIDVVPGNPQSLAVASGNGGNGGVAVYDNGTRRPSTSRGDAYEITSIEFGANSSILHGYDGGGRDQLVKFTVDATGVQAVRTTRNLLSGYGNGMKFAGGRLYHAQGRVVDPEALKVVGTFRVDYNSVFAVDPANNRIFFVDNQGYNVAKLTAFDTNTFLPVGSITLPGVIGTPTSLVRWGMNGLALRTAPNPFGPILDNQVYIIQTALVSDQEPIPTGVQFEYTQYQTYEGNSDTSFTVWRTGDASGTTTVDYVVGGGTATPGADYTAASGTLTFAPGELEKTFSVSTIDDNVYEPQETFNITLSNPSGSAVITGPNVVTVPINDSDQPYINLGSASVAEPDSGTTDVTFTVQLSNPSSGTITVNYSTADGTATAGSDYTAASGTLTFPPLSTTATINVKITGDTLCEDNETFNLTLSGVTGGAAHWGGPSPVTIAEGSIEFPTLVREEATARALAFDAVTWVRDPLSVIATHNFSPDQRTRMALLATNLDGGDCALGDVTVQMWGVKGFFTVPAEHVAAVPGLGWLKQIMVKLPDELAGAGNVWVSIQARGMSSDSVIVNIKPSPDGTP